MTVGLSEQEDEKQIVVRADLEDNNHIDVLLTRAQEQEWLKTKRGMENRSSCDRKRK